MALHEHVGGSSHGSHKTNQIVSASPQLDMKILDYVLATLNGSNQWWRESFLNTNQNRRDMVWDWRERYRARRSVAELYQDAKNQPFPNASNLAVGIEQIFGEALVPQTLANTVDLEPMVSVTKEGSDEEVPEITQFLDIYLRRKLIIRDMHEESDREIFKVGTVFHKWTWGSLWRQVEKVIYVLWDPSTRQPVVTFNQETGEPDFIPMDPKTPIEEIPRNAQGVRMVIKRAADVEKVQVMQGPQLSIRPLENIKFPPGATVQDPDKWDYIHDEFPVSPWWFLGREGDPFDGKLQNLKQLFSAFNIDPSNVHLNPNNNLNRDIPLVESHMKFNVTKRGEPVEIVVLTQPTKKILLGWRVSPFTRRPYFNRQVWSRGQSVTGIGIPESLFALRGAMDGNLNQDQDSGNLYNHPPLLLSSVAMLQDEEYETTGPGSIWTMQDINGAKFLAPPVSKRDPIVMLNWLLTMAQRLWGVTDFNLGAPTGSLSPNIKTATGVAAVTNQTTIKFGHLTKRLEATRTRELQFIVEMFGERLVDSPKTKTPIITVDGKEVKVERGMFQNIEIRAVGNGIFTNPQVRQQMLSQAYTLYHATQNPYVIGDPENFKQLTRELNESFGLKMTLKDNELIQAIKLIEQVMQIPGGDQVVARNLQSLQLSAAQLVAAVQQGAGQGGNGVKQQQPSRLNA